MTDKEKIKQEIENIKAKVDDESSYSNGWKQALRAIEIFINSLPEEPVSEDLDKLVISLEETVGTSPHSREVIKEHLQKAAEWQKQQMKETLQTEYKKGRFDMREEMVKNTILETKVIMDCDGDDIETPYEEWLTLENTEIPSLSDSLGLKDGDKVKIIIIKED